MNIEAGQRLLHYRLIEKIGEGGMGVVWKAADTTLDREVAIKILPETLAADRERLARFEREAKLLASLNHPGIAAVYGFHECEGTRFLAMELVKGEDLSVRLSRGGLPIDDALELAKQTCRALEAAHDAGVVHRDLKPANVMLTTEGKVKVLDFGLAKAFAGEGTAESTSPSLSPTITSAGTVAGMILGTAAYMSPEQAKGKRVDRTADTWAFGVLVFEMLTGRQPFVGETVSETLAAVLLTEPDLAALPAQTPPVVRWLLERCLTKDPRQRLRDIGEARIALEQPELISLRAQAPPARGEPKRLLPWAVAVAMALLAALALWAPWRPDTETTTPLHLRMGLADGTTVSMLDYGAAAVISPDGSRLAYVADEGSGRVIHLRELDRLDPKRIAGSDGAYHPFFSPDGQWIGYVTRDRLKKVSVLGGTPIELADVSLNRGATWLADGTIVFAPSPNSGLARIPDGGGEPVALTELSAGEYTHRWPQVLPGAKAILFTAHDEGGDFDNARIELVELETRRRKVLHRGGTYGRYVLSGHVVFAREGTLYGLPFDVDTREVVGRPFPVLENVTTNPGSGGAQFDVSLTGTVVYSAGPVVGRKTQLVKVERGGEITPLTQEADEYSDPKYSPDGRQLAVCIGQYDRSDVWVIDLARGSRTRLSLSDRDDWSPVWSPDGRDLAFSSRRDGVGDIYRKPADGSRPVQRLTEGEQQLAPRSWSSDGRFIAVALQSGDTGWDIAVLDVEEGKLRPLIATRAQEVGPAFLPDGHWLAYQSDESGTYELYVQRFPEPGGKWQVSTAGCSGARLSPNGSEIFCASRDRKLLEVPFRTDGDRFIAGNPVELLDLTELGLGGNFDVSPDGGHFVFTKAAGDQAQAHDRSHVNLIFDWFSRIDAVEAPR